MENKNTIRKRELDLKLFHAYYMLIQEIVKVEEILPVESFCAYLGSSLM